MNPSSMLPVFSLVLSFLLHSKSQGIRLDEGFSKDTQLLKHQAQNSGGCDDHEASLCNRVQNCNSTAGKRAKNRKLFVPTSISTTHTTASKKAKMIENNKNARVKWAATSWKQHEELVGIAEMDYTAARRKPPIHN